MMKKYNKLIILLAIILSAFSFVSPVFASDIFGQAAISMINQQSTALNITAFGAVGDGVTDNTTAIQNCFTAAAAQGKAVFVPKGRFVCDNDNLPGGGTLLGTGPGSVLVQPAGISNPANTWWAVLNLGTPTVSGPITDTTQNAKNITIRDIAIQGNAATGSLKGHLNLINIFGVSHALIQNVSLLGPEGDGIYISGQAQNTPASVTPSSITYTSGPTVTVNTTLPHGLITGQSVTLGGFNNQTAYNGTWLVTVTGANAFTITLYSDPGSAPTLMGYYQLNYELHNEDIRLDHIFIDGINRVGRNGVSVIDCDGFTATNITMARTSAVGQPGCYDFEPNKPYSVLRNLVIEDNHLTDFGAGPAAINLSQQYGQQDMTRAPIQNIDIERNYISSAYATNAAAIQMVQTRKDQAAITDTNAAAANIIIKNNDIYGTKYGIWIAGLKGVRVEDNYVRYAVYDGIVFGDAGAAYRNNIDVKCLNNYLDSCGRTTDATGIGIGNNSRLDLIGNILYDCGSVTAGKGYSFNFSANSTTSYVNLINNTVIANTNPAWYAVNVNAAHTLTPTTNVEQGNHFLNFTTALNTNQFLAYVTDDNNNKNGYNCSVLPDSFPDGLSVSVDTGDGSLPGGYTAGLLQTYKYTAYQGSTYRGDTIQYFYPNSSASASAIYYRKATDGANTWGAWVGENGTGNIVMDTSPTITTPTISTVNSAAATALTLNATATQGNLAVAGTNYYNWTSTAFLPNVANTYNLGSGANYYGSCFANTLASGSSAQLNVNASATQGNLQVAGTTSFIWVNNSFLPNVTNSYYVGNASHVWATIYTNTITQGSTAGVGIVGATNAGNATAGNVGETITSSIASGSAVTLTTTATPYNITTISLTAGDWDVEGNINYALTSATVVSTGVFEGSIGTTTATLAADGTEVYLAPPAITTSTATWGMSLPRKRINVSSTTTVYLVGEASWTAGSAKGYGTIIARRVR